jgi:hypothetical protein
MRKAAYFVAGTFVLGMLGVGGQQALAKGSDSCPESTSTYVPVTSSNGVFVGLDHANDDGGGDWSANYTTVCWSTTPRGQETPDETGGALKVWLYNNHLVAGGFACFNNPSAVVSPNCGSNYWAVIPEASTSGVGAYGWTGGTAVPTEIWSAGESITPPNTSGPVVAAQINTPCVTVNSTSTPLCNVPLASVGVARNDVTPTSAAAGVPTGVILGADTANDTVQVSAAGTPASVDTTRVVPVGTCAGICP